MIIEFVDVIENDEQEHGQDSLCYYVEVDVAVDEITYTVCTMVGARESEHGSVRASGSGVKPFCDAWQVVYEDLHQVPNALKESVRNALVTNSYELFQMADARVNQ